MDLNMSQLKLRKTDPINADFIKSQRFIINDRGVFYKTRGGRLNGPFDDEKKARSDLKVFIEVLAIEEQLDSEDLHLFKR